MRRRLTLLAVALLATVTLSVTLTGCHHDCYPVHMNQGGIAARIWDFHAVEGGGGYWTRWTQTGLQVMGWSLTTHTTVWWPDLQCAREHRNGVPPELIQPDKLYESSAP